MTMGVCRSCNAAIIWSISPAGKTLPLDGKPILSIDDVRLGSHSTLYRLVGVRALKAFLTSDPAPLYISHFATCPNASQHSRR